MSIDRVLATLEQYFDMKDEVGASTSEAKFARERAGMALNEYIQRQFDLLIMEERRRSSSITRRVEVPPDASAVQVSWIEVARLLDALNSPPMPPKNLQSGTKEYQKWMDSYREWYEKKRGEAMRSMTPVVSKPMQDSIPFIEPEEDPISSTREVEIKDLELEFDWDKEFEKK